MEEIAQVRVRKLARKADHELLLAQRENKYGDDVVEAWEPRHDTGREC